MDIKKAIPSIIDLEDTTDFKKILRYLKGLNKETDHPLRTKELRRLIKNELRQRKQSEKTSLEHNPFNIQSSKSLIKSNIQQDWIIQDILAKGSITILSAKPGSFKTWLTMYFAMCIYKGESVFGVFETKKAGVLIIDEEDSAALIKDRLIKLGADKNLNINFSIMTGFKADNKEKMQVLEQELVKRKISVLIIDSLVRIHSGDENSAKDMSSLFRKISWLKKNGITVLINHHHRKGQNSQSVDNQVMRGSVDILAALDCHMMITKEGNDLILTQSKNRYKPEIKKFIVSPVQHDDKLSFVFKGYVDGQNEQDNKKLSRQDAIVSFIQASESAVTQDDLSKKFEGIIGKNALLETLKDLEKDNKIKVITENKNRKLYTKGSVF